MTELPSLYASCEPIAVIGLVGRFPDAPDAATLWRNLLAGKTASRPLTSEEMAEAGVSPAMQAADNFVAMGAPLEGAERFDAGLFGYSRQEAETIDPQQRLFLQGVWHVLEHAGYAPRSVPHKTGVFGAARMSTYPSRQAFQVAEISQVRGMQALIGNDKDYVASRAAYKLDLRGPALTVQTACSSSLVAVHMACESLRAGECDMAVAGGVGVSFPQHTGYLHQPGMIFSPDGLCRPFDADAQGTFAGNGLGLVALRRLDDALRDGDPVIAVLRGSAINNDGNAKVGFTAPSAAGQFDVIREAMLLANVDADAVGMIEAHGTATALGDSIELEALRKAFEGRSPVRVPCVLGSLKSNIGHLDTAAGVAGLIKAILAVSEGMIAPTANFRRPHPALHLEQSPFRVLTQAETWTQPLRTAGVSSFGIGGTNCHVIVQSLPAELSRRPRRSADPAGLPLLLSAGSEPALRRLAGAYASAWTPETAIDLTHTALHGRQLDLEHRLAMPILAEAQAALAAFAAGEDDPLLYTGQAATRGKLAWIFTGLGSQWPGMGSELYRRSDAFAAMLDRCSAACGDSLDPLLREAMFDADGVWLQRMDYAQPAIVAFELAMAAHWSEQGLRPDVVLGHSWGEYAACAVAGHASVEDIMALAVVSGRLMQRAGEGHMLAAFADAATLDPIAARHGVELAADNAEQHRVYSGSPASIAALAAELEDLHIRHRRMDTGCAAHSAMLEPFLQELRAAVPRQSGAADAGIALVSSLLGAEPDPGAATTPEHWVRHMREPVRYRQAVNRLRELGVATCLELGPDATLTDLGQRDEARHDGIRWIASMRRDEAAGPMLDEAAARLFAAGWNLPWQRLFPSGGRRVQAPLYPFDERCYWWHESAPAPGTATTEPCVVDDPAIAQGRQVARREAAALDMARLDAFYACLGELHSIYVDTLVRACLAQGRLDPAQLWPEPGSTAAAGAAGIDAFGILRAGRLLPRYRQLLERLLNASVEDGYLQIDAGRYRPVRSVPRARLAGLLDELRGCCEGFDVIANTVARAGENLYAMMSGAVEPVAVIFPAGQSTGVEVLYQDFSFGRYFNQIAAAIVDGWLRERTDKAEPLRVLEVGGGTGGTTAWLLPVLARRRGLRYDFTDVSPIFSRRAQQKFASYDFVDYREFDLQRDAQAQGFESGSYDLIIAANVVHATQHVGRTLANLRFLLKPGGQLLLREITLPVRFFDFVFGPLVPPLLDEQARHGQLFLSTEGWARHCREVGFERVQWLPEDGSPATRIGERVLLAGLPGGKHADVVPVTDTNRFEADWSDVAGDPGGFIEHIRRACATVTDRTLGLPSPVPSPPAWLRRVRWREARGVFGTLRVDFEACDPQERWQPLLQLGETDIDDPQLSLPCEAPGTHYTWRWEPLKEPPTAVEPVVLEELPRDFAAVLKRSFSEEALPSTLILVDDVSPVATSIRIREALAAGARGRLIVLTRGAWALEQSEVVVPAQRSVWGLVRVASAETRERAVCLIDLAADAPWTEAIPGLAAVAAGQTCVAVRAGVTYRQRLHVRTGISRSLPPRALRSERWQVVTGAFGGLGRFSVRWLASQGARRIALLAPRAHPDWLQFQADVQGRYGCTLRWLACDVADPSQLVASLDQLERDGGLEGAVHAAGTLDDAPLLQLDAARLEAVFAVKADAARVLQQRLRAAHGRYLLLFSSAAAALGPPGQAAHALACAYLDGLADATRAGAPEPFTISLAWGAWSGIGRVAEAASQAKLAERGMLSLTPAEGRWHLEQALLDATSCRLAMRVAPSLLEETERSTSSSVALPAGTEILVASDPATAVNTQPVQVSAAATDDAQSWLIAQLREQLRLDPTTTIDSAQDLLQLGMDSLLFLELSAAIAERYGLRLNAALAYEALTVEGLCALIRDQVAAPSSDTSTAPSAILQPEPARRYEPFPLTPIQHAYWLGRTELIGYGGVACHVLFEWDLGSDFALKRFEAAWNALVRRHDMLRMVVDADGQQRILPEVPKYRFERHDLRGLATEEREARLQDVRQTMSYRVLPADRWPLFEIAVSLFDRIPNDRCCRLHMNLDLLQFDTQSFKVMMDDLAAAYAGAELPLLALSFRDYVMAEQARRESEDWKRTWVYWQDRLPQLPPSPQLPLAASAPAGQPRLTAYQHRLDAARWSQLKQVLRAISSTPSAALLALFARVLERWAKQPEFTINLTFFNRRPVHPDVPKLIGDFTSVLLADFAIDPAESLRTSIELTQAMLWQHLAHADVNGVELLRELGRQRGEGIRPLMPVVFTSMLGMSLDGLPIDQALGSLLGDPVYMFTQTPQVWLDHQVMEVDGELISNWFCMDEVLAEGVAEAIFADYTAMLDALATEPERLDRPMPPEVGARDRDARVLLRRIEAHLRAEPAIRSVRVVEVADGSLKIDVVASDVDIPSATPKRVLEVALPELTPQEQAGVETSWRQLEARALDGMAATLARHGLFRDVGACADLGQVQTALDALPRYRRLLGQWLRRLCTDGRLRRDGEVYVAQRAFPSGLPSPPVPPDAPWSRTMAAYLEACLARHDMLFEGRQSPLELLFDGDNAVARSLYSEHPALRLLNRSAAVLARALTDVRGPLDVLEVGAGTGATTEVVLPMLQGQLRGYRFTDVSTLFLDEAKRRFGIDEPLRYALLDINRPADFTQHPLKGYDLIVAANVLHDATHVVHALRRLRSLLADGGHLLLIEATVRDSAMQLASVGFIEGLSAYQDRRVLDEQAMLTVPMWREALQDAGFSVQRQWPADDDSPTRQHLLLARARAVGRLDTAALESSLRKALPGRLPPLHWRQCELLPTGQAATAPAPEEPALQQELDVATDRAVVVAVGTVWSELLGRRVSDQTDFFREGGDSLIATRMIGRLNRQGYAGATLQALFTQPVLAQFCRSLVTPGDTGSEWVLLADDGSAEVSFVLTAADGDPAAYLPLARRLGGKVYGLPLPDPARLDSFEELIDQLFAALRSQPLPAHCRLIGWSYGAFLAAHLACRLHAERVPVDLVLLDPVSHEDFRLSSERSLWSLLAQGPVSLSLPEDLAQRPMAEQRTQFLQAARLARLRPFDAEPARAHAVLDRVERLLSLAVAPPEQAPPIACLWIEAQHRPAHWRAAEPAWRRWIEIATRQRVDADHWQLATGDAHARQVADAILAWSRDVRQDAAI